MDILEEVQRVYASYQEQFKKQEHARRPGEGIFGLGVGPRNYPCHSQFAQELEALLGTVEPAGSGQTRQVLEYIYSAPLNREEGEDAVYWMLLAAHRLTLGLIDLLEPADAQVLLAQYQSAYPRRKRMDAQDKVIAALQRQTHR